MLHRVIWGGGGGEDFGLNTKLIIQKSKEATSVLILRGHMTLDNFLIRNSFKCFDA